MNNKGMSTTLNPGPIPPDVLADGEAIVAAIMAGKKPDPALARKVRDRAERMGRVSTADGFSLWSSLMVDCPQLFASLPLMPRAYSISSSARLGIYDCLYVALSEQEGCEIVTDDARLAALFPKQVVLLSTL